MHGSRSEALAHKSLCAVRQAHQLTARRCANSARTKRRTSSRNLSRRRRSMPNHSRRIVRMNVWKYIRPNCTRLLHPVHPQLVYRQPPALLNVGKRFEHAASASAPAQKSPVLEMLQQLVGHV